MELQYNFPIVISKKDSFIKYLSELWKDISLQSDETLKGISHDVFFTMFNYSYIIKKQLFNCFVKSFKKHDDIPNSLYINLEHFIDSMSILFSNNQLFLYNFIYDLYDYDNDNIININDIKFLLNHIENKNILSYNDLIIHNEKIFQILNKIQNALVDKEKITKIDFYSLVKMEEIFKILYRPLNYLYEKSFINQSLINYYEDLDNEKINILNSNRIKFDYMGFMFKITKNEKLKIYFFRLISNHLFYYKSENDKKHIGMHFLSYNLFIKKNEKKVFKEASLFSFSIIYPHSAKTFYVDKENEYNEWVKKLENSIHCFNVEDYYKIGEKIEDKSEKISDSDQSNIMREYFQGYEILEKKGKEKSEKNHLCTNIHHLEKNIDKISEKSTALIKKINKTKLDSTDLNLQRTEIDIYKLIKYNPYLMKTLNIFEDKNDIYLITEPVNINMTLLTYLQNDEYVPNEKESCSIIHQLLMALYYLNYYGVVHRNLKPENILLNISERFKHNKRWKEKVIDVKIFNFSLSKILNYGAYTMESYGTLGYAAPEILLNVPYNEKIDVWSIGIITYLLLTGNLPFDDEHSEKEIARQTIYKSVFFKENLWARYSKEVKNFICDLLTKDFSKRPTIKDALVHEWIAKYFKKNVDIRNKCIQEKGFEFECFSSMVDEED